MPCIPGVSCAAPRRLAVGDTADKLSALHALRVSATEVLSFRDKAVCVTRIGVARPIRRLPGIVGMVLLAVGVLQKIGWVKVLGLVLAAPVFWCYFGVIFIFLPLLIIDKLRRGRGR